MAARYAGARTVIAVDRIRARLDLALELGADHAILAGDTDVVADIMRLTGDGVDQSLDTTAVAAVMRQAIDVLAPRGICGFVTAPSDGSELPILFAACCSARRCVASSRATATPNSSFPS
jgi:aryl-alcohol dehydrogenase